MGALLGCVTWDCQDDCHKAISCHGDGMIALWRKGSDSIYSVAVDIRPASDSFGKYTAEILSAENRKVMYVPKGFVHGYLTLEPNTLMQWCVDADFCAEAAQCLRWDDTSVNIPWPLDGRAPVISEKDRNGRSLMEICIWRKYDCFVSLFLLS